MVGVGECVGDKKDCIFLFCLLTYFFKTEQKSSLFCKFA